MPLLRRLGASLFIFLLLHATLQGSGLLCAMHTATPDAAAGAPASHHAMHDSAVASDHPPSSGVATVTAETADRPESDCGTDWAACAAMSACATVALRAPATLASLGETPAAPSPLEPGALHAIGRVAPESPPPRG